MEYIQNNYPNYNNFINLIKILLKRKFNKKELFELVGIDKYINKTIKEIFRDKNNFKDNKNEINDVKNDINNINNKLITTARNYLKTNIIRVDSFAEKLYFLKIHKKNFKIKKTNENLFFESLFNDLKCDKVIFNNKVNNKENDIRNNKENNINNDNIIYDNINNDNNINNDKNNNKEDKEYKENYDNYDNGINTNSINTNSINTNGINTNGIYSNNIFTNGSNTNVFNTNGIYSNNIFTNCINTNSIKDDNDYINNHLIKISQRTLRICKNLTLIHLFIIYFIFKNEKIRKYILKSVLKSNKNTLIDINLILKIILYEYEVLAKIFVISSKKDQFIICQSDVNKKELLKYIIAEYAYRYVKDKNNFSSNFNFKNVKFKDKKKYNNFNQPITFDNNFNLVDNNFNLVDNNFNLVDNNFDQFLIFIRILRIDSESKDLSIAAWLSLFILLCDIEGFKKGFCNLNNYEIFDGLYLSINSLLREKSLMKNNSLKDKSLDDSDLQSSLKINFTDSINNNPYIIVDICKNDILKFIKISRG
ncbi:hypothetical protein DMUE_2652 [Dictyocoela muelleri]|nr:hypothetical protein DMUE_2652 [Dictyocoela muelleri]